MDYISSVFAPHAVKIYTDLNRQNIPPNLARFYRPVDDVKVYGGITVTLSLPRYRSHEAQHLFIPYGEDWTMAQEHGKEWISRANSHIASRNFSPILVELPSQLRLQAQFFGVSLTIWDARKLGWEMQRVAGLFGNGGHVPYWHISRL